MLGIGTGNFNYKFKIKFRLPQRSHVPHIFFLFLVTTKKSRSTMVIDSVMHCPMEKVP